MNPDDEEKLEPWPQIDSYIWMDYTVRIFKPAHSAPTSNPRTVNSKEYGPLDVDDAILDS